MKPIFGILSLAFAMAAATGCSDPTAADSARAYIDVATGGEHSCALSEAGDIWCWGRGLDGELGNGEKENRAVPAQVLGDIEFKAVTAGDAHSCGLARDGTAYCWGWNAFFQRGNSVDGRDSEPVRVTTDVKFVSISAGAHHTCALGADSLAYCWGYNRFGQLGNGTTNTTPEALPVAGGPKFRQVTAGAFHSCAVALSGAGYCWGKNDVGQLGLGANELMVIAPVPVGGGVAFAAIDGGATHTCGVATDTRFYCWGSSEHGELGDGTAFKPGVPGRFMPFPVSMNFPAGSSIDAGTSHTCAIGPGGAVRCWGRGQYGQLANGSTSDNFHPQPVNLLRQSIPFTRLGLGGHTHACGIADKSVYCWGTGHSGQLGVRQSTYANLPQRVGD